VRGWIGALGAIGLGAVALGGCAFDGEIAASCEAMAQHRRECGFADDAAWCSDLARYRNTPEQKQTVLCVLDCHRQASCEDIALHACMPDDESTAIYECWRACMQLSDLLLIPPAVECPLDP